MEDFSSGASEYSAHAIPAAEQGFSWLEKLECLTVVPCDQPARLADGQEASCVQGLSASALGRVQRFLDGHLGEALELEDLAQVACMSRFHFYRRFRQSLNQSPMRYVLKLRVDVGKDKLLREKGKTIAAIASELGFCDQSHFTRSFRRLTGMTPALFARRGLADTPKQSFISGSSL